MLDRVSNRCVRIDGKDVRLTDRESSLLDYLLRHRGTVVTREALEVEVWGHRTGVRSETIPVTLRTLRRKLGDTGQSLVSTVYGVGWRVSAAAEDNLPSFQRPYVPRPAQTESIQAAFDAGWRWVTLVAPGGVGKTRLAIQFASEQARALHVSLAAVRTEEGVVRALLNASGTPGMGVESFLYGFEERFIVLDEAENVTEELEPVLKRLCRRHRVLMTSRRPMGGGFEFVHRLRPWEEEEARGFLRLCLAASGHALPTPEALDEIVHAFDGNALAMELFSSSPLPPQRALRDVLQGTGAGPLDGVLRETWAALTAEERSLLVHLAACRTVALDSLVGWLGEEIRVPLDGLLARGLVSYRDASLELLFTLRRFVQKLPVDHVEATRSMHHRLVSTCRGLNARIWTEPLEVFATIQPMADELVDVLPELGDDVLPEVLWTLFLFALLHGPLTYVYAALALAPAEHPFTLLLRALLGAPVDARTAFAALSVRDQHRILFLQAFRWLPDAQDLAGCVPAGPTEGIESAFLALGMLPFEPDLQAAESKLLQTFRGAPLIAWCARYAVGRLLARRGQPVAGLVRLQQVASEVGDGGLGGMHIMARHALVDILVVVDREEGVELLIELGEETIQYGFGDSWVVGRVGLMLALLGHPDARRFLERASHAEHPTTSLACMVLKYAVSGGVREVEPSTLAQLHGTMWDGTPLAGIVNAVASRSAASLPPTTLRTVWETTLAADAAL